MMEYEIFKEVVAEKFADYMTQEYRHREVKINAVDKINKKRDGLRMIPGENDSNISPTIYLDDMYNHYKATGDLEEAIKTAAEKMTEAFDESERIMKSFGDIEDAKDNIVFQLVNTEQNREMLKTMPNRSFQDLSIIYRWVIGNDENGIQSAIIHDNLAERLELTEEQLFRHAVENTRRILPPTVKSMNDLMREMCIKDGLTDAMVDMMLDEMPKEQTMWVISNDRGINGAISMLYEDKLHSLAEDIGTDLYIMPSSVHEVIAISAAMGDPNELAEMVADINMSQVALDERLSNQVYHYDKDLRRLTLATDTPNKRLDGIVAEEKMIYPEKQR